MGLTLKLLGEFALRDASGAELSLPTRKTRALLGYLAVNADRPQPRERLMALLWSDRGERQARQSLNQALLSIRKLADGAGATLLDSDGERVTLRGDTVTSDVARLRALIAEDPAKAATHYDGPFLDGLSVPDPAFEDWLLATRSELHALACDALEAASNTSEDTTRAIECANRLVALDPLREDTHRRLMELLHQSGDRAGALRQYQACAEVLQRDLQVEPDAATKALYDTIRQNAQPKTTPEPAPAMTAGPVLPDEPSLAVLPFDVIGSDPQTIDLAEGLVEDLITALAKVRDMLVIDRHSTESYRDRAVNVREAATTLGVRYVLTGSIRTAGDRLRCSVQLVDAVSGRHVWAERYDRTVDDVFALQDEIVWHILLELQVRLTEGDSARIASRGTRNLEAWLLRVQGANELGKYTRQGVIRSRELFEAARKADPEWARPLAAIAYSHYYEARFGWAVSREDTIALGIDCAEQAIAMDPEESFGYQALRGLNLLVGNHEEALTLAKKAAALAPNDQLAVGALAVTLSFMDEFAAAIDNFERVIRLGPTVQRMFQRAFGLALLRAGQTDRAMSVLENLVKQEPEWPEGLAQLAATYAEAGRDDAARATIDRVLGLNPTYTVSQYLGIVHFQNPKHTEWLRELLTKAGLPEGDAEPPS